MHKFRNSSEGLEGSIVEAREGEVDEHKKGSSKSLSSVRSIRDLLKGEV